MTDSVVLANGNTLKIVQTSGSGGGKWGRPGFLNLVEIVAGSGAVDYEEQLRCCVGRVGEAPRSRSRHRVIGGKNNRARHRKRGGPFQCHPSDPGPELFLPGQRLCQGRLCRWPELR